MFKNTILAVAMVATLSVAALSGAQEPTKTAPNNALTWRDGLPVTDVNMIGRMTKTLGQQDKYMVWTAIVRNREASKDMYRGEPLSNDKVLANVRVRMSTDESSRWTTAWSHMNSWDRQVMIRVLRDDLAIKR